MNELEKTLNELPKYFIQENAKGLDIIAQIHLIGEREEYWLLTIENQECIITKSSPQNVKINIIAETNDFFDILSGKLDPMRAYMQGKLILEGNILKALRLLDVFRIPDRFKGNF